MPAQTSYTLSTAVASYAGQLADSAVGKDMLTGITLPAPAIKVAATVANTTVYTLTFVTPAGNVNATYTSDGSATKAEFVAGMLAAVNALGTAQYSAVNYGGDLVLVAKPGVQFPAAVTSTGAGTLTLSTAATQIPFGCAVALDKTRTADTSNPAALAVRLPNASGDTILGLCVHTHYFESTFNPSSPVTTPAAPAGSPISILRDGRMWVTAEVAVAAGDPVYARYASGGNGSQLGAIGNTADSSSAAQLTNCTFLSAASAGGLALVQVLTL